MTHATEEEQTLLKFVNTVQAAVNAQEVTTCRVSAFTDYVDGTTPSGSAAARENVVSQSMYRFGIRTTVSSVTSVLMCARTQLSRRSR